MAVTRLKLLNRQRILQSDISILLETNGPTKRFTASLNLASYDFPPNARILLDAKQVLETIRFDLGTIAKPLPSAAHDISRLRGDRVVFGLQVVDPKTARKLGSAEAVRPSHEKLAAGGAMPLLPVDASADLEGLLWRIDFSETDQENHTDAPVLRLEKQATDGIASTLLHNAYVRGLVLPAAMREILTRVLILDSHDYAPDSMSWRDGWTRFAVRSLGEDVPGSDSPADRTDFIERSVSAFARSANFLPLFLAEKKR